MYYFYDGGNAVLATTANGGLVEINMFAPDGLVKRLYTAPTNNSAIQGVAYTGEYYFDWQGNAVHILDEVALGGGSGDLFDSQVYAAHKLKPGALTGTLIHSAYNAWGQKNFLYPASSNVNLHVFGYNARWGYRTDTQTGLFYCQNRYYSASDGRWLNRDPIGYSGGTNLYGYCGNGPVGGMDPRGYSARAAVGAAAVGIIGLLAGPEFAILAAGYTYMVLENEDLKAEGVDEQTATIVSIAEAAPMLLSSGSCALSSLETNTGTSKLGTNMGTRASGLFRFVEEGEEAAMHNAGGGWQPSKSYEGIKVFWTNEADATKYGELWGRNGVNGKIFGSPGQPSVGYPGPSMDGSPTWIVPEPDLPGLGSPRVFPRP